MSWWRLAERSCWRLATSVVDLQQSTRYWGALPCRQRWTVTPVLPVTLVFCTSFELAVVFHITPFSGGKREDLSELFCVYCVLKLCTVISILRWAVLTVLWIGFCHTGPISLSVDLFGFICVYFVCFCFILHSCIIVSVVGLAWWDWSLILRTYLPSVLWHCWLGHWPVKTRPDMTNHPFFNVVNPGPSCVVLCVCFWHPDFAFQYQHIAAAAFHKHVPCISHFQSCSIFRRTVVLSLLSC